MFRVLDLYCGDGGAGAGYRRAGCEVTGVDLAPHPRYPFTFHQGDAVAFLRENWQRFDFVHASPPCQFATTLRASHPGKEYVNLIPATRQALIETGLPWVIENVPNAGLQDPVRLCGSMFGLGARGYQLRRHRDFELSGFRAPRLSCRHDGPVVGVYGGKTRIGERGRVTGPPDLGREAMQMDWSTMAGLAQAIPPAYTEYLFNCFLSDRSGR